MKPARAGMLLAYLSQVPDPHGRKGRRHSLSALLTAAVCGLLCGARGHEGFAEGRYDPTLDIWHWRGFLRRSPKNDRRR